MIACRPPSKMMPSYPSFVGTAATSWFRGLQVPRAVVECSINTYLITTHGLRRTPCSLTSILFQWWIRIHQMRYLLQLPRRAWCNQTPRRVRIRFRRRDLIISKSYWILTSQPSQSTWNSWRRRLNTPRGTAESQATGSWDSTKWLLTLSWKRTARPRKSGAPPMAARVSTHHSLASWSETASSQSSPIESTHQLTSKGRSRVLTCMDLIWRPQLLSRC